MNNLKVLDVTLRDGGCVNDFNFGQAYMEKILNAQENAGVDVIELGYIDEKRGSQSGRTQYINEQVIPQCILKHKKPGVSYVVMMDYGKFDVSKLGQRTSNGIDGIRVAFHKKNCKDIIALGRQIIDKGYQFYIQPMITLRYSDIELLNLISLVNAELPDASGFYIVDSFGEMRPNDMSRMLNLVDHNLISTMPIGFHSHNNIQLSLALSIKFINNAKRDIIIDSTLQGIGRGAGNTKTELLLEYMNRYKNCAYNVDAIWKGLNNKLMPEKNWEYTAERGFRGINNIHPYLQQ